MNRKTLLLVGISFVSGFLSANFVYVPRSLARDIEDAFEVREELVIRYNVDGTIDRARFSFRTWEAFYRMVERESGFRIEFDNLPAGGISTVLTGVSWEQALRTSTPFQFQVKNVDDRHYKILPAER